MAVGRHGWDDGALNRYGNVSGKLFKGALSEQPVFVIAEKTVCVCLCKFVEALGQVQSHGILISGSRRDGRVGDVHDGGR